MCSVFFFLIAQSLFLILLPLASTSTMFSYYISLPLCSRLSCLSWAAHTVFCKSLLFLCIFVFKILPEIPIASRLHQPGVWCLLFYDAHLPKGRGETLWHSFIRGHLHFLSSSVPLCVGLHSVRSFSVVWGSNKVLAYLYISQFLYLTVFELLVSLVWLRVSESQEWCPIHNLRTLHLRAPYLLSPTNEVLGKLFFF